MNQSKGKYIHNEIIHNSVDPLKIVSLLDQHFAPESVVDFGCGIGNFLYEFKKLGVKDILGIDGSWVDKKLLDKNLDTNEYAEVDLEKNIVLDKKYDLVLSLEVAEHLHESKSELFVKSLINAGDLIVFSAAIPGQGGQNHINEKPLSFWVEIFANNKYFLSDIIRPEIWNDKEISWWYRQNIVVFRNSSKFKTTPINSTIVDIVIPDLLDNRVKTIKSLNDQLYLINNGHKSAGFYIKLLIKNVLNHFGLKK